MMRRRLLAAQAAALAAALAAAACGRGRDDRKDKLTSIFLHGDPMAIVAGTAQDKASPFKTAELAAFADFTLYGGAYFHERSQHGNAGSAEEGNEASSGDDNSILDHFAFEADDAGGYQYRTQGSGNDSIAFRFRDDAGTLGLTHVRFGSDEPIEVEPLHYSVTPTKDTFSLLFKLADKDEGNGMIGVYFTKNTGALPKIETTDSRYNYLLGPGLKAGWTGPIKVDICGELAAEDEAAIRRGLEPWAVDGKIAARELTIGRRQDHPPWSDVNARCVKLVSGFAFEDQADLAVYGITLTAIDKTTATITASSIIIAADAFSKSLRSRTPETRAVLMSYVTSHEFGHFLGLDHEFDDEDKHRSLMSYEFDDIADPAPRAHDREAVARLYE